MAFLLRRYSITHRAVGRLRELDPAIASEGDEALRDRIDGAIRLAEAAGEAVETLDALHGEPQIVIPLAGFGRIVYAVIKENTVVTLLRRVHGDAVLTRSQPEAAGADRSVVHTLREIVLRSAPTTPLTELWTLLADRLPGPLTVGDLVAALTQEPDSLSRERPPGSPVRAASGR